MDHRSGRHAQELLAAQHPDGTFGSCFHSMALPGKSPLTTEQALRRLQALGFTMQDEPIRRIVATMGACLRGERKIDAYWEKGIDWAIFEPLMLASWIRRFAPDDPDALALAMRWARVAEAAFLGDGFHEDRWLTAYEAEFRAAARHPNPIRFTPFYHVPLLAGLMMDEAENALAEHLLNRPDGVYYLYPKPLIHPPAEFASRETSCWLAALELLRGYRCAAEKLRFAAVWLCLNRSTDGSWDLGPKANDKVYFPLSDSWRSPAMRRADCTERILAFLPFNI